MSDRWTWDKDDVEWDRSPPEPGAPPLKPLLDAEGIKIARENLRRIRAGLPLLNGSALERSEADFTPQPANPENRQRR